MYYASEIEGIFDTFVNQEGSIKFIKSKMRAIAFDNYADKFATAIEFQLSDKEEIKIPGKERVIIKLLAFEHYRNVIEEKKPLFIGFNKKKIIGIFYPEKL
jgi:hypothetical protein